MEKEEFKAVVWYSLLFLLVLGIVGFGSMAINGTLYPWWLSIQRKSVEQSKSFTDANNTQLVKYIAEYSALDADIASTENEGSKKAYKSQQDAIVNLMCQQISTMADGTVKPSTLSWVSSHGGCK